MGGTGRTPLSIILDANTCIHFLNGTSPSVVEGIRQHESEITLCSVVKSELLYGARNSARVAENLQKLRRLFSLFPSFDFDDLAAEHAGVIRADLRRAGTPIGQADTMIAAIARAHDATLVTHNMREFVRIVGLRLEDWES